MLSYTTAAVATTTSIGTAMTSTQRHSRSPDAGVSRGTAYYGRADPSPHSAALSRSPSYSPRLSMSRSPSPAANNARRLSLSPPPRRRSTFDDFTKRRQFSAGLSTDEISDSAQSRSPRRPRNSRSPSPGRRSERHPTVRSVAVMGLSEMVYEVHLEQIFGMYGAIQDIIVPRQRRTGEHNGTAYIIYQSASSVAKAEENMKGGQIDGCIVDVHQELVPPHEYEETARTRNGRGGVGGDGGSRARWERRGRHKSDRDERHIASHHPHTPTRERGAQRRNS